MIPQIPLAGLTAANLRDKTIKCADLFCGAGGTSTGLIELAEAFELHCQLTGVNHWPTAIKTHQQNHPASKLLCEDLHGSNPYRLFHEFELDILWASPSCVTHSAARGGRPIDQDQDRATPWCVIRWIEACKPAFVFVENVPQFIKWGPVDTKGQPIKSKEGQTFGAWINAITSIGYRLEWRILCAADFGDPTTRERLFIEAVRGKRKIIWPNPTHTKNPENHANELFSYSLRKWIPARDIIDWTLPANSIFNRPRPLVDKTMKRVWAGFKKFALPEILRHHLRPIPTHLHPPEEPFLLPRHGHDRTERTQPLSEPVPTVTGSGVGYLITPTYTPGPNPEEKNWIVRYHGQSKAESIGQPLSTVEAGAVKHYVASAELKDSVKASPPKTQRDEAFLIKLKGTSTATDPNEPLHTIQASGLHHALVTPALKTAMIMPQHGGGQVRAESEPIPTVASKGAIRLIESSISTEKAFVVELGHGQKPNEPENGRSHSLEQPIGTITGSNNFYLAESEIKEPPESFLLQVNHADTPNSTSNHRIRSLEDPLPTVCGNRGEWAVADAQLNKSFILSIDHQGPKENSPTGGVQDPQEPLSTITAKARHCVVDCQLKDIPQQPDIPPIDPSKLAYLIKYFKTGTAKAIDQPLDTITGKHRFALVQAQLIEFDPETEGLPKYGKLYIQISDQFYEIDLTLRMLEPHELALAQGFREDYRFHGTKTHVVKQIGNAVPRRLAKAIVVAALTQNADAPEIICRWEEQKDQLARQQPAA